MPLTRKPPRSAFEEQTGIPLTQHVPPVDETTDYIGHIKPREQPKSDPMDDVNYVGHPCHY